MQLEGLIADLRADGRGLREVFACLGVPAAEIDDRRGRPLVSVDLGTPVAGGDAGLEARASRLETEFEIAPLVCELEARAENAQRERRVRRTLRGGLCLG